MIVDDACQGAFFSFVPFTGPAPSRGVTLIIARQEEARAWISACPVVL